MALGEQIGEGAWAEVFAWAPGQVVKLFRAGVRRRTVVHEARMTRAAFAAGLPAPEVLDEVSVEGRFGIVMRRLEGPTLLHLSRTGAMTHPQVGAVLAGLCLAVHRTPPSPEVISLRDWMALSLPLSGGLFDEPVTAAILALIERLPPGEGLCHVDLHPGNVIMTAGGPVLIDWAGAVRAGAALDLACCQVLLSEHAPELADNPERPRAVNAALQADYARLAGLSLAELAAAVERYLPVVCVFFLLGRSGSPALQARLRRRLEAALRSED